LTDDSTTPDYEQDGVDFDRAVLESESAGVETSTAAEDRRQRIRNKFAALASQREESLHLSVDATRSTEIDAVTDDKEAMRRAAALRELRAAPSRNERAQQPSYDELADLARSVAVVGSREGALPLMVSDALSLMIARLDDSNGHAASAAMSPQRAPALNDKFATAIGALAPPGALPRATISRVDATPEPETCDRDKRGGRDQRSSDPSDVCRVALAAQRSIRRKDVHALRALRRPPLSAQVVLEGVGILLEHRQLGAQAVLRDGKLFDEIQGLSVSRMRLLLQFASAEGFASLRADDLPDAAPALGQLHALLKASAGVAAEIEGTRQRGRSN